MIVMKFGGTSMGTSASIKNNVASLVKEAVAQKKKPLAVVSAMTGVTNDLLAAADFAVKRNAKAMLKKVDEIHECHRDAVQTMIKNKSIQREAREGVDKELSNLHSFLIAISTIGELSFRSHDIVISVGEKLSALMLAAVLNDQGCSAEYVNLEAVITDPLEYDSHAYWDHVERYFRTRFQKVKPGIVPVATGFFGPTDKGILNSVGRGYSDFCASLAGAALKAKEIQIWTDVDGVLSTNPKIVKEAFILEKISFDEMAELAHFGAKVLHPNSVRPALLAHIPIRIVNTFNPQCPGTLVTEKRADTQLPFKSIAYKTGVTVIRISSPRMLMAYGFMAKICNLFEKHKVSIDLIATSEISVSMSVEEKPAKLKALLDDLKALGEVSLESNQSVISIVGTEMEKECYIQGRVFEALNRDRIKIHMASLGNALINLSFTVNDADCHRAVQSLHHEFFKPSKR